jgi:TolA-binding protein
LGEISYNQRDYAKSIEYFQQTLDVNFDKRDVAHARIADSFMRVGKKEEAKVAYQTLLQQYPRSSYSPKAKKMLQQL